MLEFLPSLLGGVVIGLSATLLYVLNGRIAGISGILGSLLEPRGAQPWRLAFLGGLLGGGVLIQALQPSAFGSGPALGSGAMLIVAAGLLVGFGTRLGSGCTSGHGICGIGRGSKRSIVATLTFMATSIVTVFLMRSLMGGVS